MDQDIIRKNNFGQLSYCKDCGSFHLTFSNILIELSDRELRAFHMVVKEIDIDFWKNIPNNQTVRRNFPINTSQQNLVLIFDFYELEALKELVMISESKRKDFISCSEINYEMSLN